MKRCISMAICFTIIFLMQSVPAFAESISNASASIDSSRQVTVSGAISSGAGQIVNVRIVDPKGNTEYVDSTISKYQGSFIFSYTMTNNTAGKYDVTINASGVSSPVKTSFSYGVNNDLKALSISSGAFDRVFSPEITQYTATIENRINNLTVTPSASDSTATIKVNDRAVESGSPSNPIKLNEGANTINVAVTALDGNTKTYTIMVTRQKAKSSSLTATASIDADKKVTVSGIVSTGSGQIVSLMITDPAKKVEYAGAAVSTSGGEYKFTYTLSNNAKGRYNVSVSALGASPPVTAYFDYGTDAGLKSLSLSSGSYSPAFSADVTAYTASVGSGINSITVTPSANDKNAGIKVNNRSVTSGSASSAIPLNTGANTINVDVTAQDGVTKKTYTIVVNKNEPPPTGVSVQAQINKDKLVTVSGTVGSAGRQVSVMITDPGGKSEYLGAITSGAGGAFQLSYTMSNNTKGRYNVAIGSLGLVTPAVTYFIYGEVNADLKDLSISSGSLTPQFTPDKTEYKAYVERGTASIKVTPTAMSPDAIIKVNNVTVPSGSTSGSISLAHGDNTIMIVVTAPDGTTKTYVIIVRRELPPPAPPSDYTPPPLSGNNNLSSLTISSGTLAPVFAAGTTSYNASVANNVASITVTPTVAESHASVKVNGETVASGSPSAAINLREGSNTISIVVTAENGTAKTYTVTVTMAGTPPPVQSSDATLSSLVISSGTLNPVFAAGIINYTADVGSNVTTITVIPVVNESNARVMVNGTTVTSGSASGAIDLNAGSNTISIVVTAENGTTNTYTVTVTRAAGLSGLGITGKYLDQSQNVAIIPLNLTPQFASGTTYYEVPPDQNMYVSATVTPTVSEGSHATVTVDGTPVDSGVSIEIAINSVGDTTINVVVTAQDGTTTKTYKIVVKK